MDPLKSCLDVVASLLANDRSASDVGLARVEATTWSAFVATNHLQPFVLTRLATLDLFDSVPESVVAEFERQLDQRRRRQRELVNDLEQVSTTLEADGIGVLVLKGPYLAQRFFGDIGQRIFGDIDLLVRREDLDRAETALASVGFTRRSRVFLRRSWTTRFCHGFDFRRGRNTVDLHWTLGCHPSYRFDLDAMWSRATPLRLGERVYRGLCDDDALLFHCVSMFEDLDRGALRVKGFIDLHRILGATEVDWDSYFAWLGQQGVRRICATILAILAKRFPGCGMPPGLSAALRSETTLVPTLSTAELDSLLDRAPGNPHSKRFAMNTYECHPARHAAWWTVSLPFRLAGYHQGTGRRWGRTR